MLIYLPDESIEIKDPVIYEYPLTNIILLVWYIDPPGCSTFKDQKSHSMHVVTCKLNTCPILVINVNDWCQRNPW